jgi:nickel-dependent lactate racemase
VRIELYYGRGTLPVDLPDDWDVTVIRKPAMPVLAEPPEAMRRALERPVGSGPLIEEARGAGSACILICDMTRPVPNRVILQPLIRELMAAGLDAEQITVLIATGLHRPVEGAELEELVGDPWVLDTVRVENHFARDDAAHVDLGTTPRGTRVGLDRRFVEADLRIATGLVEPHFMAGYSGGRKVIAPGVAHRDTITTFHNAAFMEHPLADSCVLDGNPLHEEQVEIVRMIDGALAVNAVIDEERQVSFLNFGEVEASHLEAVDFVRRYAEVGVPRRFATIVSSAAGFPLDSTYYQTVKGMVSPVKILEPGGTVIVASSCSEGFGSAEYLEAQKRLVSMGPERFIDDILGKEHAAIDEWQTEMQIRTLRVGSIQLYTEALTPEERALTGVEVVENLLDAISASVERSGDRSVAVIPEGPYVVPFFSSREAGRGG